MVETQVLMSFKGFCQKLYEKNENEMKTGNG